MAFLSPNFFIQNIRIGAIENASCLNMGNNVPNGFENHQKLNQGFGTVHGDENTLEGLRSILSDSALLDMMMADKEQEMPEWLTDLIKHKMEENQPSG
ncbi:hypothetical protein QRD89_16800 [Halobacillus sp. ACCC02827]|uniref:hypothetical protein n=1 Tax=Bacillaceae TaxID=186817 RepID=UPI0002A51F7A|nr:MULTISPECIES: hypothetical protein [Bacillaceae]ELK49079.1 hypothetical protein D479_00585 [Halobacillus sp. BAB-2008]QHT48128.1 hypothetical protein M662_17120 [Bacillus sp. SB49]WJE15362.1 hypothetical protein QRD89_16800 [Halobacillus sp. ACCC02827]